MDKTFELRLYWWTQRSLFPIPSFTTVTPPLDPVAYPADAEPAAVRVLKTIVREGLRLPPDSDVFVTTADGQAVIPDDVSSMDLLSGKHGKVSVNKPLRLLVAGNWTVDTAKKSPSDFYALRREIAETGLLPRLPPVDNVGIFTAFPTFASSPDDWLAAVKRLMAATLHQTTYVGTDQSSIRHGPRDSYSHEHADVPPPYEAFLSPCRQARLSVPTSVPSRHRRGFFKTIWKSLCS
jgi:hypothetical protein